MKPRAIAITAVAAVLVPAALAGTALFGMLMLLGGQAASGAGNNNCTTGDTGTSLAVETTGGLSLTLDATQLSNAGKIMTIGLSQGAPPAGIKVALMTALQESKLRMLANENVPKSLQLPNEGVGSDHDSVNLFQQRPSSGWGTVDQLMNSTYAIQAFFGGPNGPNHGSPAGLLDIDGWANMRPGQAAQRVQVSGFPDAYDQWEGAADKILNQLGGGVVCGGSSVGGDSKALAQGLVDAMTAGRLQTYSDAEASQIRNMANGTATPDCQLDVGVLQIITFALQHFNTAKVSSLNRRCIGDYAGIGEASYHWKGEAVDFSVLDGMPSTGSDPNSLKLIKLLDPIMPAGQAGVGQYDCRAADGVTLYLQNFIQFPDGCTHLHLEVRQPNSPLNFPAA